MSTVALHHEATCGTFHKLRVNIMHTAKLLLFGYNSCMTILTMNAVVEKIRPVGADT